MAFFLPRAAATRAALACAGIATVATACGGGGYGAGKAAATNSQPPASGRQVVLAVRTGGSLGSYLTDASGRTLYMFAPDTPDHSACTGSCATYWPPLIGRAGTPASAAVQAARLSTIRRGGGTQVTYAGHPLYFYVGDAKPGDTKGEGRNLSGGTWWLLAPSGAPLRGGAPATSAAPTGSTSSGSSGYGGYGGYGGG